MSARLLDAWRWFERVSTQAERTVVDKGDLDPLIDAAIAAAQEHGFDLSRERIAGALKVLCKESLERHLERLVSDAARGPGPDDLPLNMVKDILKGRPTRGAAAHGGLRNWNKRTAEHCVRSRTAIAALCFLTTGKDLPLTSARRDRLCDHPLVKDYRHSLRIAGASTA